MAAPIKDISGRRFGKLIVKSFSHIEGNALWNCLCDCGRYKKVKASYLIKGSTKSCGCLINKNKIKKWKSIVLDEFALKIPLSKNVFTIIDKEDLNKIKNFGWYCGNRGYARNRNSIMMHRIIMECPSNKEIDHINHDCLDNRKRNLRICNRTQNQANRFISSKNISGFKGVSYKRDIKKFQASISYDNRQYFLGYYLTAEEAQIAYEEKGKELFKEFFNKG